MKTNGNGQDLNRNHYIPVVEVPALKFWKNMADRRLNLLVECAELFYRLQNHYVIDEVATNDLIEKIEEEIGSKIDLS